MVIAGRPADGPPCHENAAQKGFPATGPAKQFAFRCLFRGKDLQLAQCFRYPAVREDFYLIPVILFQPPRTGNDNLRLHLVIGFQNLQDPAGQGCVFCGKMDPDMFAAEHQRPAHAQHTYQLRLFAAGLLAFQTGQFVFNIRRV